MATESFNLVVVNQTSPAAKRRFIVGGALRPDGHASRLTFFRAPATNPPMSVLPPCPHLPPTPDGLDWRSLHAHRDAARGAEFYFDCLQYGQSLWQRNLAARAILCLDRAFGADLRGDEPVLLTWPLPYAAMGWLIAHTPEGVFLGNPRVHFQHYAGRMNEPRREQRRTRAWACWAIARAVAPNLPGDPRHQIAEPTLEAIAAALRVHGHPGEADLWHRVLKTISP